MKGSSSRLRAAKGSTDKGSTIQEHSRSLDLPQTREDIPVTMEPNTHNGGGSHKHNGPKNGNGSGAISNQNRSNPATPAKKDLSHITCFKCGNTGHYATECPEAKNGNGNGSSGKKPNPFNRAQVNHISVEEVEEQPDAVIGKFLVKSFYRSCSFRYWCIAFICIKGIRG